MTERKGTYITDFDLQRLQELLNSDREFNEEERPVLFKLVSKLEQAKVVDWKNIPSNVVTMNSKVRLKDVCTSEEIVFDLVFPPDANPERNRVSILTPIGTAVLECYIGEIINLQVAEEKYRWLVVEEIPYQPEACGNFNLPLKRESPTILRRKILVTAYDLMRLSKFVAPANTTTTNSKNNLKKNLGELLEQAEIVTPWEIPNDVVTMNSKVRLKDSRIDEEMVLTLVFPTDANVEKMNISILTPIGLSIFGRKVGDIIERDIKVEELLYQPEAAGHFHL